MGTHTSRVSGLSRGKLNRTSYCPVSMSDQETGQRHNNNSCVSDAAVVRVRGRIHGLSVVCLVDTGASRCFINKSVWERTGSGFLSAVNGQVKQADGEFLEVMGTCEVTLELADLCFKVQVSVCDNLIDDCILGCNFIRKYKCVFKPADRFVEIQGRCIPELTVLPAAAVLRETILIPARTELVSRVEIIGEKLNLTRVVEPSPRCWQKFGCLMGRGLVSGNEGAILLRNPSNVDVVLRKNTHVGIASLCSVVSKEDNVSSRPAHTDFNWEEAAHHLTSQQLKCAQECIDKYSEVVSRNKGQLGRTNVLQHKINTGNARPIRMAPRRLPLGRRTEAQQEIQHMLDTGVISPSKSPWCFPAVLIKKKDGAMRFCVDFRRLNEVTVKDSYPLPRVDTVLESLAGATLFSALDLQSGYWQCEVDPEDRPKTAFSIGSGLYEFNVLPFGVCNGPATFQRLMDLVLDGMHWESALVYLDDVIVFGRTFEEHLERLSAVLKRLKDAGLKLNPKKCRLFHREVEFLGHIVNREGVAADPKKVQVVREWPTPTNLTELRSFLGLASYYRRFVPSFAELAAPLHRLLNKGERYLWNEECEVAFRQLKQKLVKTPVLAYPNPNRPFIVDVDASGYGIGGVLSQVQNGLERPIAYFSRALTKTERRYCVTRRELLALVSVCRQFKSYLLASHFIARTDHNCLQWLRNFKEPEGQVARWLELLAEYHMTVEHRPGKKHGNADGLSRRPCLQCGLSDKGTEEIARLSCAYTSAGTTSVSVQTESNVSSRETDVLVKTNDFKGEQYKDECCKPVIRFLRGEIGEADLPKLSQKLYALKPVLFKDLLCLSDNSGPRGEYRVVVPSSLVNEIVRAYHGHAAAGAHLGVMRTLARIKERFFWFQMQQDVTDFCRNCEDCNRRKSPSHPAKSPLISNSSTRPLQRVALDILGPLPTTEQGNKYILVVGDYFTKWTEAYAIPDQTAETVAKVFVNEFVCRYGTPETLHSDQGRQFESGLFQEMCRLLEITKTRTSPFRPQSDGMIERFNRTLLSMLSHWAGKNQKSWDCKLPQVMLAYRTSLHESTKNTPFFLMFGREIRLPLDTQYGLPPGESCRTNQEYVKKLRSTLDEAHVLTRNYLLKSHRRQKEYYDRNARVHQYNIGDLVWLHQPVVRVGQSPKLHKPWTGPYRVVKVVGWNTLRVQHCALRHKRMIVHQDRLKPCSSLPPPEQAQELEIASRRPGRPKKNLPPAAEEIRNKRDTFIIEEVPGDLFNASEPLAIPDQPEKLMQPVENLVDANLNKKEGIENILPTPMAEEINQQVSSGPPRRQLPPRAAKTKALERLKTSRRKFSVRREECSGSQVGNEVVGEMCSEVGDNNAG